MTEEIYTIYKWIKDEHPRLNPNLNEKTVRIWASDGYTSFNTIIKHINNSVIQIDTSIKMKLLAEYDLIRSSLKDKAIVKYNEHRTLISINLNDPKCFEKLDIILNILENRRHQDSINREIKEASDIGPATLLAMSSGALITLCLVASDVSVLTIIITDLLLFAIISIAVSIRLKYAKKLKETHDNNRCRMDECPCA